jgi:opacity protein-like surface antigen
VSRSTDGLRCIAVACALVFAATAARALPPEEKDWEVQATFYGWAASIDAEVEAGDVSRDLEVKFQDLLGDLGWAVMGNVEARWKRALVVVDALGMQVVSDISRSPRTVPFAGPGGNVTGDLTKGESDVHTRLTTWALDTKLGVRALSLPTAKLIGRTEEPDDRRRFDVDLFAGLRYWNVTNKTNLEVNPASLTVNGAPAELPGVLPDLAERRGVRLPPGVLRNGTDRAVQDTVDWVDPIVGARIGADVTKRWSLFVLGDVGGWSIGNASELTWQAMLGSQIQLSERWGLQTGYRALGIDQSGALESTILHGPQIGAFVRF